MTRQYVDRIHSHVLEDQEAVFTLSLQKCSRCSPRRNLQGFLGML